MSVEPLAFAPPLEPDETLWSWTTRVALYHGWSADQFLMLLGFGTNRWESYFRQADMDCGTPPEIIERLANATGYPYELLNSHVVAPSPSNLWLDDRVAFCEACWSADAVPYVRRAWINAWCIECAVHRCSLLTIKEVRRPRYAADWNAAWSRRPDWAERTRALCTPASTQRGVSSNLGILRPLGAIDRVTLAPPARDENVRVATEECERRLVLLCGKSFGEWSMVRAYFDVAERLQWRNVENGYDPQRRLLEPLGSLDLRSGAIRLGRALFDILFDQPYREPRLAGPLRSWVGGLFGRPRGWLMEALAVWPSSVAERWKRQFEWTDEFDWIRCKLPDRNARNTGSPQMIGPV